MLKERFVGSSATIGRMANGIIINTTVGCPRGALWLAREHRWGVHTEKEMDVKHIEENEGKDRVRCSSHSSIEETNNNVRDGPGVQGGYLSSTCPTTLRSLSHRGDAHEAMVPRTRGLTPYRPLHVL